MDNDKQYYDTYCLASNKKENEAIKNYCNEHNIYYETFEREKLIHFRILMTLSEAELISEYLKEFRKVKKPETVWDELKD